MSGKEEMASVHVRLTPADHERVCAQAERDGSYSVPAWMRALALRATREGEREAEREAEDPGYGSRARGPVVR